MYVILKKYSDIRFYYLRITSRAIQCEAIGPQQWFCLYTYDQQRPAKPQGTRSRAWQTPAMPENAVDLPSAGKELLSLYFIYLVWPEYVRRSGNLAC